MTVVTGFTAARSEAIEAACIVAGGIVIDHIVLTRADGATVDAGSARGPIGSTGGTGPVGPQGPPPFGGEVAVARTTSDMSVPDSTITYCSLQAEDIDMDSIHSTTVNPTRLTCVRAGIYLCAGQLSYEYWTDGSRGGGIQKNRASTIASGSLPFANSFAGTSVQFEGLVSLVANDYVEMYAFQHSTSTLDVFGGAKLSMTQIA